ncbi:MAG TPA: FG-GAP-like repeat-containing protein [Solirubrobacterales bacterium]|nr:FG-GAP-like repeat-containing protein [Solirubrobacterales bacterium]
MGEGFGRLKPEVFRLMLPWNSKEGPPAGVLPGHPNYWRYEQRQKWIARTHAMIDRARTHGVDTIVVTLRSNTHRDYPASGADLFLPSVAKYEQEVTKVIQEFALKVDVWGGVNEPNLWPTFEGNCCRKIPAATLAEYQSRFAGAVNTWDSSALDTSPDFSDNTENWKSYVEEYKAEWAKRYGAGGAFANVAALHTYGAIQAMSLQKVNEYAGMLPAGKEIWVTEAGAHFTTPQAQAQKVAWMTNGASGLASHDRVTRIAYYHMRDHNSAWDTALMEENQAPRPAWYTWCAAAHGNNGSHPDCTGYPPPPPWRPSFNGDTMDDLIVADPVNARFAVATSDGWSLGSTGTGSWLTGWGGEPVWADVGDFNGDNRSDLISADPVNARFAVALSNGSSLGATGSGPWLTGWGGNPTWADVGDFNGDRKSDLIVADSVNGQFAVATSSGTSLGASGSGPWLTGWGGNPTWADVGDFNGDGKDDLIVSNATNNTYAVALSSGAQLGAAGTGMWLSGWDGSPEWAGVGDFNGDGRDDLIMADPTNARYAVAISNGSSLSGSGTGVWLTGWGGDPEWADVADVNGDGKDDLIVSNPANNTYAVALSNGTQLGAPGSGVWLSGWDGSPVWAAAG